MSEETNLAINAYIEKFGYGLPIDFELRLKDPNSDEEWIKTIQNAKSAVSFPLPGNRTFSFYIFHRRKSQKAEPFLGSAFF